ncbi:FtsX-like permease family protein, partial [Gemmatimonadota bacterium]
WVSPLMTFVLKTEGRPEDISQPATEALQRADPDLPAFAVASMEKVVATELAPRRTFALLLSLFGLQALVLAAIGIYGVVSFAVTQRVQEIGIRLSLGGAGPGVLRMLWSQGIRLGLAGALMGFPAAVAVSRILRTTLFEIQPLDLYVYSAVAALVLFVISIASLLPALRAMRVGPAVSMKAV